MFGISGTELFIILVFVLLIFGPDKLPAVGRTVGQMMREFKRAQQTMESLIKAEVAAAEKQKAEEEKATADTAPEHDGAVDAATESAPEVTSGDPSETGVEDPVEGGDGAAIPGDVDEDIDPLTAEEAGGWTPGPAGQEPATPDASADERKGEKEAL